MLEVYHATIQDHGRVVIPAEVRQALGLTRGVGVVLRVENGAVVIAGLPKAVRQFQAAVRARMPAGVSLADELIADRRAAVADE